MPEKTTKDFKEIDNLAFWQTKMRECQKVGKELGKKQRRNQLDIQMCQNNIVKEYTDRIANNYLTKWEGIHPSKIDPALFNLIFYLKTNTKSEDCPEHRISFNDDGTTPHIRYKNKDTHQWTELLP